MNTDNKHYRRAVDYSRAWAVRLDRTPLGDFAVDMDVLVAAHAHMRGVHVNKDRKDAGEIIGQLFSDITDSGYNAAGKDSFLCIQRAKAEVVMWWSMGTSDRASMECMKRALYSEYIAAEHSRLRAVYENPELHTFFRAGVWDVPFILACVKQGVDPSLARSINYSPVLPE